MMRAITSRTTAPGGLDEGSAPQRPRPRWPKVALRLLVALLLLLLADYAVYPLLPAGGRSANRGENGLWLRYLWYFGRKSDAETVALARRLREHQISDAWFHVRSIQADGTLKYRYPDRARRLTDHLRRLAPGVGLLAWIYAGNPAGRGEVDLSRPAVRRAMVREAVWLTTVCGFDGVQWDYEICPDGDPHLLALLRETRAALPSGKIIGVATAMWLPRPFRRWGWSDAYFTEVSRHCDQLAVMGYDSGLYLPRAYTWLLSRQVVHVTRAVARGNPRCRVHIGVPTYAYGGPSHHPPVENIAVALKGVRAGVADRRAELSVFAGVAPFADYTTQPEEWATYRRLWLEETERDPPGARKAVGPPG
jgi:hypothetical protein